MIILNICLYTYVLRIVYVQYCATLNVVVLGMVGRVVMC